ncbi:MAG: hypothetical protein WBS20_08590, partial [Lysobacterales bacterium]
MKTMKRIITLSLAALLLTVLGTNISFAGKPARGGGKVSVDAANPNSAIQGEERDIYINGSGFGPGASVKYLVNGTTDDTQIEVLSTEYIESTGELKTHVKVKDDAVVIDYDIEVQAASGRKGKGTTLFKVLQKEDTACTGFEDPTPSIAYLTALETSDDIATADINLASDSGCHIYTLLEDAAQEIPGPLGRSEAISKVFELRLDIEGWQGVIIWRNTVESSGPPELNALSFVFDGTNVLVDPAGPRVLYIPPNDWRPYYADIRIDDAGGYDLVLVEKPVGISEYRLVHVHFDQDGT